MNKEKEQELREQYKDRGELTVNFILFAYDHYGDLLDFSDTYVEDQSKETILDIKDYCRVKVVPRVFMLQPGTFCYNIIERAIDFVDKLREKRKDVAVIPKKTVYKGGRTITCFLCTIHKKEIFGSPDNVLRGRKICKECSTESKKIAFKKNSLQFHQERLDEKYGVGRFTILEKESLEETEGNFVFLRCNKCGNVYKLPYSTIRHYICEDMKCDPCPNCDKLEKDAKRLKYFIDKFTTINENRENKLDLDFSKSYVGTVKRGEKYNAKIYNIKCNKCGLYFDVLARSLMYMVKCPHCSMSVGETIIESWLRNNKLEFTEQYSLKTDELEELGYPLGLLIDFTLTIENREYWIEYNGEQHYSYCPHFKDDLNDFYSQLKRDEYVCNYCERNNITLIELPWTLKLEDISCILNDLLINKIPHPYEFPKIRLNRKKEFPDTGLYRSEFLKQNGLL